MKSTSTGAVHVVDGGAGDLETSASVLSKLGYRPVCHSEGAAFLRAARSTTAVPVLIDWRLPGKGAVDVVHELRQLDPAWSVIAYSSDATIADAVAAMRAGAVDFLLKPVAPEKLAAALIGAAPARSGGGRAKRSGLDQRVLDNITHRQLDVLRLLVDGHQNKSIAFELQISERTVEAHRARMMRRLQIQSFAELIALAVRSGIGNRDERE